MGRLIPLLAAPFTWPAPRVLGVILTFSAFSLAGAYIAQYGFGLRPCILCLYQRVPSALAILVAVTGLLIPKIRTGAIAASGLLFLAGAAIAAFHTGVEQHWWRGFEGCSAPALTGSIEDVLKAIETAPAVACDAVPWTFLGLSMAGYNFIFSAAAGAACLLWVALNRSR